MEHYSADPNQRSVQLQEQQKSKSLFIVEKQGLQWFSTKKQCEEMAKKLIKDFDPQEYLAQKIVKYKADGKDHFYAVLYKDFSKDHSRDDLAEHNEDIFELGRIEMGRTKKDNR